MEQCYKDALRKNRSIQTNRKSMPLSYEHALFSANWDYISDEIRVELPEEKEMAKSPALGDLLPTKAMATSTVITESVQEKSITEKTMILDSLHQFGKDALEENDQQPVKMQGAEITAKLADNDGQVSHNFDDIQLLSQIELQAEIENKTTKALTNLRYNSNGVNRFSLNGLKVIFIGDILQSQVKEGDATNTNEFLALFNSATADLFGRMVKAMKLAPEQYLLSATSYGDEKERNSYLDTLLKEILFFKPELIITLGAAPTHVMLNMKKRLKEVHGSFSTISVSSDDVSHKLKVMPLFSPNLLNTAPNMKKTAWLDMQKAMEVLGV